ncbi:MMPL family transporter [Nocardia terrae]|uniref:MMPL family transporter n=1 Tax=Nocardia terrae TaxID=2675851 RepID=UPI0018DF6327|nr:MMPL family transporter [Nocardia terrae]
MRIRLSRRIGWVVIACWVVAVVATAGLAGKLGSAQKNDATTWLPKSAESTKVSELAGKFTGTDVYPAVVVYDRGGAVLDAADRARVAGDVGRFTALPAVHGTVEGPIVSEDGKAIQVVVPITVGAKGILDTLSPVKAVRAIAADSGMSVHVTGPGGYGADSADAFSGVNSTLLYVTIAIVVVILLVTYRSPVLWLLPLLCVGVALTVAQGLIYLLAAHAGLTVNSDTEFLLTVLVFGAGTDYALLLTARYREELRRREDRYESMATAIRRAGPTIAASAITVALSLLCLVVADLNSTKSLGPVMATGVIISFAVLTTLYPALLVLCGRWIFWPAAPSFGDAEPRGGRWGRILERLTASRPRRVWQVTAAALAVLGLGLFGLHASGLQAQDTFRTRPDAVVGEQVLLRHFPGGSGDPLQIVGPAAESDHLRALAAAVPGVVSVSTPVQSGGLAYLEATSADVTGSDAAFATVERLRTAVHAVPGAMVGGSSAVAADTLHSSRHDRNLVVPLVLSVVFLIMAALLRALVAPALVLVTVVLSLAAALGVSAFVFDKIFGFAGADAAFPLWAFVFLVSLGIDYSIFLMARIREESAHHDTPTATLIATRATSGTITAAGVVLAGTFAALLTLPLVFAAEIGFTVAFGVLLDTFVVRTILVPALARDLGDRLWWPRRPSEKENARRELVSPGIPT